MAHSFTSIHLHLIFSTKLRRPLLTPQIKPRLFDYMGGILRNKSGASLLINGPDDHVHILARIPTTVAISDLLRDLKGDSTNWVHNELRIANFAWQTGYAAFSVSKSGLEDVRAYIANQEEHHRHVTFQEEYLAFLKRHQIDYDPRFVSIDPPPAPMGRKHFC
jgi:REP element-mobilizing transposase RayT